MLRSNNVAITLEPPEQHAAKVEGSATHARTIAEAALRAWEANDAETFALLLADDCVWENLFPQPASKQNIVSFMKNVRRAFPDWRFNAAFVNEHPARTRGQRVHFVVQPTGTHRGDLFVPGLPRILPTGMKIALPQRHLDMIVDGGLITYLWSDFSPNGLEELLAQLGMRLP